MEIKKPGEVDLIAWVAEKGILKRKRGERRKVKGAHDFVNAVTAFDIETTTLKRRVERGRPIDAQGVMYVWQWSFDNDFVIMGRTWAEFRQVCAEVKTACAALKQTTRYKHDISLVVYVHNLAFEFQFLAGVYDFTEDECFFRKPRKPIYCRMFGSLEFRCSYLQSNMRLKKFAENMGCVVRKQSGQEYDYSKPRYPWTELTEFEKLYCIDDVLTVVEAIKKEMEKDGDSLYTIPLTSTGYVRRDAKKAVQGLRPWIEAQLPTLEQYRLLRRAMRGGNTHANRYFVNEILSDVQSMDMTSCYPAQQLTGLFPVTPFQWVEGGIDRLMHFTCMGYAVVAVYRFWGLRLINPHEPMPYISLAKTDSVDCRVDNGRILRAGYSEMVLTDVDLQIVLSTYTFDRVEVDRAMIARKGTLPGGYLDTVRDYYNRKTALKGIAGKEYEYMKAKNKLNSIYGMSAQDPIHQQVTFSGGVYSVSDYDTEGAQKAIEKAVFPYQWGVYTTALARQALQEGIALAGDRIVYCDTDSIKTRGAVDFTALNTERQKKATDAGAFADDRHGIRHYMGVYEHDATYDQFITQGAKRYAYISGGRMGVTVSGVSKAVDERTGVPWAVEELQTLDNFREGFTFHAPAAGTMAVYNDNIAEDVKINGHILHIGRNVAIIDDEYTMGYSADYLQLLRECERFTDYRHRTE